MDFWLGLFMGGAIGAGFGALYSRRAKRFWRWRLGRKLQLIAARNEMKGYRQKNQRPVLANWQKRLLGWLHSLHPTLTRYTNFRPETLVGWHRRFVKYRWSLISWAGKRRAVGRPRMDASIEKIIVAIKAANPRYGATRISAIVSKQLGVDISATSVRNVLARSRLRPKTPSSPTGGQRWKTFLTNHCGSMASMDFKVTFDWRGKLLYVFNIIDHERRELVICRSTSNPSSDWVAQQIREAYPFDEAPKRMLMDHDSMFAPLVARTLPNMGIKVMRSSVGCPWQNGVVERFNRTLTEEMLDHVIPVNARHLNRLLRQYQTFYNTARPHRTNHGQSPIRPKDAANDVAFGRGTLQAESIPWLGGLHHSYRRAA